MDHPRFEPVRGAPAHAHLHYSGGGLVEFVFRLVDNRRGRREGIAPASGETADGAAIEIHERPYAASYGRSTPAQARPPLDAIAGLRCEQLTSRDFLIGSARTGRLQVGLLVGLAALLGAILIQIASESTPAQSLLTRQSPSPFDNADLSRDHIGALRRAKFSQ